MDSPAVDHPTTSTAALQRRAALWAAEVLSDREAAEALALPIPTYNAMKRGADAPPFFFLGRRRFVRVVDLKAWVDRRAGDEHRAASQATSARYMRAGAAANAARRVRAAPVKAAA